MKTSDKMTFTWYATHPKHGELILYIPSCNAYRHSYIYSVRIVADRLGPRINPLHTVELALGPMGFIPRKFYEEAGFMALTPFSIRMLAMTDENREAIGLPESHLEAHDTELCAFILGEWNKIYKENRVPI